MGDRSAFFYGTLMSKEVLYRVCYGSTTPSDFQESLLTVQHAILHGYCRHKVRGGDYPAMINSPFSSVRGTYVSGLTEGDIWRLDIFEGDEYERRGVKVKILEEVGNDKGKRNAEGEQVEVETYVWIAGEDDLEDGEWDFEEFRREKMHRWIGQRDDYDGEKRPSILEVDEAVKAQDRDPTRGRGTNSNMNDRLAEVKDEEMLQSAV